MWLVLESVVQICAMTWICVNLNHLCNGLSALSLFLTQLLSRFLHLDSLYFLLNVFVGGKNPYRVCKICFWCLVGFVFIIFAWIMAGASAVEQQVFTTPYHRSVKAERRPSLSWPCASDGCSRYANPLVLRELLECTRCHRHISVEVFYFHPYSINNTSRKKMVSKMWQEHKCSDSCFVLIFIHLFD